jgi:lysozyme
MKINDLGLWIIKSIERCVLIPYLDAATPRKWTIGWGHLLPFEEDTSFEDVAARLHRQGLTDEKGNMTQETADNLLRQDVGKAEAAVHSLVTVPLSGNEFSALVSLVFNIGAGNFAKSTLLGNLNSGARGVAQAQFHVWKKSGGKVLDGLIRRRAVEAFLFGLPVDFVQQFQWHVQAGAANGENLRAAAAAGGDAVLVVLQPVKG